MTDRNDNPLLSLDHPIPFDRIRPEHVVPAIRHALEEARRGLAELVESPGPRTYENTVQRLDDLLEPLDRAVGIAAHLVQVKDSPELRAAYDEVNPEIAAFYAGLPANEALWRALLAVTASAEESGLGGIRRRHLEKLVRTFRRAGADLTAEAKERAVALQVELSRLSQRFAENVLDATNGFELVVTDPADLAGLPESALERARADAAARGIEGWRFTLHAPSYIPFMEHAERRELRRQMHTAYTHRATDEGRDNRPLVREILARRRELARVLGYRDFADYQLEDRMAGSGAVALDFVRDLERRTRPHFELEVAELEDYARGTLGYDRLEPWDVAFVMERLRKERYELDPEELRPYFALDAVLDGLFEIVRRVFGVRVTERQGVPAWHPDVRFFEIHDQEGTHLGSFYADFFPREEKRGGAWMDDLITGGPRPDGFAPHLALIACNFTPPQGETPALLTHDEVQTLFHEFGHCLHHCLSRVEIPARAGTSVAWDFVELPSQILENWTWQREALDLFARHYRTGEPLPARLFERLHATRTFMGAYQQMRQLSFGIVDLELHTRFDPEGDIDPIAFGTEVLRPFAIRPDAANGMTLASFTHVFSGGYAAGYYSYKWAEVLDADAFSRFEREGVFNPQTGRAFVETILARGDSADPAELFREFMGRDPDPEALLRRVLPGQPAAA
jgi:oligopeptidase A